MPATVERVRRKRGRRPAVGDTGALAAIGQSKATPYLFSTPAIVAITAVLAFPVLYGVWQGFYRPEVLGAPAEWVGLQNYVDTFSDPDFSNALYRTAIYAVSSMLLATALGLFFSFALYRAIGRARFLRSVTLAPYLISSVAAAVMFRILFNGQFGLINVALAWIGIDGPDWFADPTWAMAVVVFTQVWTDLPLTILLLLGGLMTIDRSYLDAALVDGARGWQRARHVMIPMLTPQLLISTIWLSYSTVTGLGIVLPLTGGGPQGSTNTLAMEIYLTAFQELNFHEGLAIATFVIVLNAMLTLTYIRVARRYESAV
ncbi:MAG: ABC transporter permease subunit [Chloroflexi bacterium]|nr:ABC transporter permease subunit [Chloroflexota bacterium]